MFITDDTVTLHMAIRRSLLAAVELSIVVYFEYSVASGMKPLFNSCLLICLLNKSVISMNARTSTTVCSDRCVSPLRIKDLD